MGPRGAENVYFEGGPDILCCIVVYEVEIKRSNGFVRVSRAIPVKRAPWDELVADTLWPRSSRLIALKARGLPDFAACQKELGPPSSRIWPEFEKMHKLWLATKRWVWDGIPTNRASLYKWCVDNDVDEIGAAGLGVSGDDLGCIWVLRQIRDLTAEFGCVWIPHKEHSTRIRASSLSIIGRLQDTKLIRASANRSLALAWAVRAAGGPGVGPTKTPEQKHEEITACLAAAAQNPRTRRPPLRRFPLHPAYYSFVPTETDRSHDRIFEKRDPVDDRARAADVAEFLAEHKSKSVAIAGDVFRPLFAPLKATILTHDDVRYVVAGRLFETLFVFDAPVDERFAADCRDVTTVLVRYSRCPTI